MKLKPANWALLAVVAVVAGMMWQRRKSTRVVAAPAPLGGQEEMVFTWGGWKKRSEVGPDIPGAIY